MKAVRVCGVNFTQKDIRILSEIVGVKELRESLMDAIECQALVDQATLEQMLRRKS